MEGGSLEVHEVSPQGTPSLSISALLNAYLSYGSLSQNAPIILKWIDYGVYKRHIGNWGSFKDQKLSTPGWLYLSGVGECAWRLGLRGAQRGQKE